MNNRAEFHSLLKEAAGNNNVYYQPPESLKMVYPAIVYERNEIENIFADDSVYNQNCSYSVTVIDKDPDSQIVSNVSKLPMCRFNRHYKADNLNHDVFIIYY